MTRTELLSRSALDCDKLMLRLSRISERKARPGQKYNYWKGIPSGCDRQEPGTWEAFYYL